MYGLLAAAVFIIFYIVKSIKEIHLQILKGIYFNFKQNFIKNIPRARAKNTKNVKI